MQQNRLVILGFVAVVAVVTMSILANRGFAQPKPATGSAPAPAVSGAVAPAAAEKNDGKGVSDGDGEEADDADKADDDGPANAAQSNDGKAASGGDVETNDDADKGNNADDDAEKGQEAEDGADTAALGKPSITADAAKQAAVASLKSGTAGKVELENDNGTLVYNVEVGTTDVKVDAHTGAVLRSEPAEK